MTQSAKRRKNAKATLVRAVSLSLAGLILLSVVFATLWHW